MVTMAVATAPSSSGRGLRGSGEAAAGAYGAMPPGRARCYSAVGWSVGARRGALQPNLRRSTQQHHGARCSPALLAHSRQRGGNVSAAHSTVAPATGCHLHTSWCLSQAHQVVPCGVSPTLRIPQRLITAQQPLLGPLGKSPSATSSSRNRSFLRRCLPRDSGAAGGASEGSGASGHSGVPEVFDDDDLDAVSIKLNEIVPGVTADLKGVSVYLVGMMGSGKSTVGRMLANTLKYAFFDTDAMIEAAHGKQSVADIFGSYGEEYFRRCEGQVLKELAPYKNLVVATGGGAVSAPMNWSYMQAGVVAWLQAPPSVLAARVMAEGPRSRPLLVAGCEGLPEAELHTQVEGRLAEILQKRAKFYDNADLKVSVESAGAGDSSSSKGAAAATVMYRLLTQLAQRLQEKKRQTEALKNFSIGNTYIQNGQ